MTAATQACPPFFYSRVNRFYSAVSLLLEEDTFVSPLSSPPFGLTWSSGAFLLSHPGLRTNGEIAQNCCLFTRSCVELKDDLFPVSNKYSVWNISLLRSQGVITTNLHKPNTSKANEQTLSPSDSQNVILFFMLTFNTSAFWRQFYIF